jgi:hypothetical protein
MKAVLIGVGILLIAAILTWEYTSELPNLKSIRITPETMKVGLTNPKMWIYYDTSDVNSRKWDDFGARNNQAIHIPLLNALYERIAAHNGMDYNIEVLGGLDAIAAHLGGWDAMPSTLKNPKARVMREEYNWIRTAMLAKYGGLWLSPSVISLQPFGKLPDKVTLFTNDVAPEFTGVWVPSPGNPLFVKWEKMFRNRLDNQLGGYNFRNDAANDWSEFRADVQILPYELSRNIMNNKKIQLEDIFAAGTEGRLTFQIPAKTRYIVIPYNDLLDRRAWGWVLRSSEEQLMSSDLAITHILRSYPIQM